MVRRNFSLVGIADLLSDSFAVLSNKAAMALTAPGMGFEGERLELLRGVLAEHLPGGNRCALFLEVELVNCGVFSSIFFLSGRVKAEFSVLLSPSFIDCRVHVGVVGLGSAQVDAVWLDWDNAWAGLRFNRRSFANLLRDSVLDLLDARRRLH